MQAWAVLIQRSVVYADCDRLIVFVVTQAVDAFVTLWIFCAFLKLVSTCAEGAGFHPSAVARSIVVSREFIAPGGHHVILYSADLPAEFISPVQQQFSSLGAHFDYQIPSVFLCFVTEFGFNVISFQADVLILR